jgi:radical SAM protein with 4Fe4S-binding SPASM domain
MSTFSSGVFDLPWRNPRSLVLQWHITERCNLKCAHCYQDESCAAELSFEQLCRVIEQFKALLARCRAENPAARIQGLINVTGGEPFLRSDFMDLLERFSANQEHFAFGILTNGTLIDRVIARQLGGLKTAYVQVSLEGSRETNDAIRGRGTFDRIAAALRHLVAEGVRTHISFTAHRGNLHEFSNVAALGCELGVSRVWADRLIPYGSGISLGEQELTPEETREFFESMYSARATSQKSFCNTEVYMGRALQFLVGGGEPYRCSAGDRLVTLQANGDLYPCRRMPICVGNVLATPMADLYADSELFRKLRAHETSNGCESCSFKRKCGGGLKCLSYAIYGDPFVADPGCWRSSRDRTPNRIFPAGVTPRCSL